MGTGAVYNTSCAARMAVDGDTYFALCDPPICSEGFKSVGISHLAVALDPGTKVIGNAQRICVQDMSQLASSGNIVVDGKSLSE